MSEPFNPFAAPETRDFVQDQAVGNYEEFAGVERGLRLIYFGICGVFLSAMATGVLAIASRDLMIIGAAGVLISWLMLIIGPFFCLSAPAESGAKGLIGASILFQFTGFFLSLALRFGAGLSLPLQLLGQFSGVTGGVLFIFFLMKIAKFIGRDDLRRSGINVLIGAVVLMLAVVTVDSLGIRGRGDFIAILMTGISAVVLFVMYANLVNYLAKAIGSLRSGSSASQDTGRYLD